MRPMYENAASLATEREIVSALASAWGCEFAKLPIQYRLDFALCRGKRLLGFCEAKGRNYDMAQFARMGGYMLSLGKWDAAISLNKSSGLPFILAVKDASGVIWWAMFKQFAHDGIRMGGRTDRGDWQDIEPCVLIATSRFSRLQQDMAA